MSMDTQGQKLTDILGGASPRTRIASAGRNGSLRSPRSILHTDGYAAISRPSTRDKVAPFVGPICWIWNTRRS